MNNIWQQLLWKFRAYSTTFSTVVIVQIILSLLMYEGTGSIGGSTGFIEYQMGMYSLDFLLMITILTAIMLGWLLASQSIRNDNYSIVTTNLTETISTGLFLVALSIFATISAVCTFSILVFSRLLIVDRVMVIKGPFIEGSTLFLFFLLVLLAGSASFFAKTLFDYSKMIFLLLIIVIISIMRIWAISEAGFFDFFLVHDFMGAFGRGIVVLAILWGRALAIRQRKEVIRR